MRIPSKYKMISVGASLMLALSAAPAHGAVTATQNNADSENDNSAIVIQVAVGDDNTQSSTVNQSNQTQQAGSGGAGDAQGTQDNSNADNDNRAFSYQRATGNGNSQSSSVTQSNQTQNVGGAAPGVGGGTLALATTNGLTMAAVGGGALPKTGSLYELFFSLGGAGAVYVYSRRRILSA